MSVYLNVGDVLATSALQADATHYVAAVLDGNVVAAWPARSKAAAKKHAATLRACACRGGRCRYEVRPVHPRRRWWSW